MSKIPKEVHLNYSFVPDELKNEVGEAIKVTNQALKNYLDEFFFRGYPKKEKPVDNVLRIFFSQNTESHAWFLSTMISGLSEPRLLEKGVGSGDFKTSVEVFLLEIAKCLKKNQHNPMLPFLESFSEMSLISESGDDYLCFHNQKIRLSLNELLMLKRFFFLANELQEKGLQILFFVSKNEFAKIFPHQLTSNQVDHLIHFFNIKCNKYAIPVKISRVRGAGFSVCIS